MPSGGIKYSQNMYSFTSLSRAKVIPVKGLW